MYSYNMRGRCHYFLKNWHEAISDLKKVLLEDVNYNQIQNFYLRRAMLSAGQYEEVLQGEKTSANSCQDSYSRLLFYGEVRIIQKKKKAHLVGCQNLSLIHI